MAVDPSRPEEMELLLRRLLALPAGRRSLVAIAGAPASGKSTLADDLVVRLNEGGCRRAAVLPTDGYHFDDALLRAMGRLDHKGAPDTFDVGGLCQMLARLRANTEEAVAVPVFDRDLEVARGSARLISRSTDIVLVEGNYLLSNERPWSALGPLFDLSVLLDLPEPMLRARLLERWRTQGHSPAAALARIEGNDLPNGRYVRARSVGADLVLRAAP